jgi:hypothetical protein
MRLPKRLPVPDIALAQPALVLAQRFVQRREEKAITRGSVAGAGRATGPPTITWAAQTLENIPNRSQDHYLSVICFMTKILIDARSITSSTIHPASPTAQATALYFRATGSLVLSKRDHINRTILSDN